MNIEARAIEKLLRMFIKFRSFSCLFVKYGADANKKRN